ncbi:MAG TPA: hypothetical protein VJ742_12195 [Nitrososphaera sp.]|nr:hypothetical protein [Nitrososphaera sp.]
MAENRVQKEKIKSLADAARPGLEAIAKQNDPNYKPPTDAEYAAAKEKVQLENLLKGFELASDFKDTQQRLNEEAPKQLGRAYEEPDPLANYEVRIGGSRFFIPPLNINVSQTFRAGSMGGALRSVSSPKFNSGHSETLISMTLYFPTHETIWGYEGRGGVFIDFDKDDFRKIDMFISSLRGLIAQFRYAPFLPIRSDYLNKTFDITAVALQSMTVSTLENFPFCLVVNLTMLKFNHKAFLPMIEDFNQAIHWGRFRQYIGRAAARLEQIASKKFIDSPEVVTGGGTNGPIVTPQQVMESIEVENFKGPFYFNKDLDIEDGRVFDIYYPSHDPAPITVDELGDFTDEMGREAGQDRRNWWQALLGRLGVDVHVEPNAEYTSARNNAEKYGDISKPGSEAKALVAFMEEATGRGPGEGFGWGALEMGPAQLNAYIAERMRIQGLANASQNTKSEYENTIRATWFAVMYNRFMDDPRIAKFLATKDLAAGSIHIQEWEVPMVKLGLDPTKVFVQGVSVSMGNNIARMQLQMQDEPVMQHIGGLDTTFDIDLLIIDYEDTEVSKIRRMFQTIGGIARLEHAHGVLGFVGIKNIVTALCGMKYAMPQNFEVETMPNFPHVYKVRLSFLDFDVFQQKREMLSNEQQAELITSFSKMNPFLRIRQLWGIFSAYPDFPLAIRDDNNKVIGNLDPDFYFRQFEQFEDDIADLGGATIGGGVGYGDTLPENPEPPPQQSTGHFLEQEGIHYSMGSFGDPNGAWLSYGKNGLSIRNGTTPVLEGAEANEPTSANTVDSSYVEGLTPPSSYTNPYMDGSSNPRANYANILKDSQYRDKSGRMVRAFPTYMLWFIQEGDKAFGAKMFDNFYGLQSVLDFSVVQSEDIMGDVLVLRLSNLYSRLTSKFRDFMNEDLYKEANLIRTALNRQIKLMTGFSDYLVQLDSIDIKPGVRVHLRVGYGSNPNNMDTVFNGVITQVTQGEVVELVCQSDAVELGAIVNTTNKGGHTGKIDGNMLGLYLSEPRDLMLRLLTMGSSTFREVIAHGVKGQIFSENRFGIRHFGSILYEPMSDREISDQEKRGQKLESSLKDDSTGGTIGAVVGFFINSIDDIIGSFWKNLNTKRDFEIFKRNIYPGNGLGIAQYVGGDISDGGLNMALEASSPTSAGIDPANGLPAEKRPADDPLGVIDQARANQPAGGAVETGSGKGGPGVIDLTRKAFMLGNPALAPTMATGAFLGDKLHPILSHMGITDRGTDDDVMDEVAFRGQTYMKTVWDLFLLCAALLPNYIVAVRPFEGRSTLFYGKPHWTYTSGVIPVTTGIAPGNEPEVIKPDEVYNELYKKLEEESANDPGEEDFYRRVNQLSFADPTSTTAGGGVAGGTPWAGGDPMTTPSRHPGGAFLLWGDGPVVCEMHLPTDANLDADIQKHLQLESLEPQLRHPHNMDRSETGTGKGAQGGRGGVDGDNRPDPSNPKQPRKKGDKADWPGRAGAFGILTPEAEQWYFCQRWGWEGSPNGGGTGKNGKLYNRRVLIYNPQNKYGVVCTPGDSGPAEQGLTGISPDAFVYLGRPPKSVRLHFGFVDDNTALGPVNFSVPPTVGYGDTLPENPETPTAQSTNVAPPASGGSNPQADFDWLPPGEDPATYSFEHGWKYKDEIGGRDIPVNYTDEEKGYIDEAGNKAEAVYLSDKNRREAKDVWTEFREGFEDSTTREIFDKAYPELTGANATKAYNDLIVLFKKNTWQNPFLRGWIAKTADENMDKDWAPDPGSGGDLSDYNFHEAHKLFREYITKGLDAAISYAKDNMNVGDKSSNIISRLGEESKERILEPLGDIIKKIQALIGGTVGSLLGFIRLALMQLSNGLSMASNMQKKTNVLNRILNDSIYYKAGAPGTLAYYVDNPFTREFGEPVVEIREPFQRVHYLDSFQHIISNGLQENHGVATVITAISNGKHPQTVHFDKGAPAEYQMERVVETGLYWDKPDGWFGLQKLWHPIQGIRQEEKAERGASDEVSSKRVGLWHLKESLKDIYGGEILVLGDANIRPHDLVYLGDVFERIYGLCEVEQVVHHFTPETGFITAITPNALVTINDPARWYLSSWMNTRLKLRGLRKTLRESLKVRADASGIIRDGDRPYTVDELAGLVDKNINGLPQYAGGVGAIVKDMAGLAGTGSLVGGGVGAAVAGVAGAAVIPGIGVGALAGGFLGWKAWDWVKDNLLDQHGCYIQYLTKDGSPMDAGLSHNQGVAVGQQHGITALLGSARVGFLPTDEGTMGGTIKTSDLLKSLGYSEKSIQDLKGHLDSYTDQTYTQLREATGRSSDGVPYAKNVVVWVRVREIQDGDTVFVTPLEGSMQGYSTTVRFAFCDCPEDQFKNDPELQELNKDLPGPRASLYTKERLEGKNVALRIVPVPGQDKDDFGRTIAFVFHNGKKDMPEEDRKKFLMDAAGGWPDIAWDSYTSEGLPYTFNKELLITGNAQVETDDLGRSIPGSGVVGGGQ